MQQGQKSSAAAEQLGRSRGGLTTKIHARIDGAGLLFTLLTILGIIHGELTHQRAAAPVTTLPEPKADDATLLVGVTLSGGQNFINIALADVKHIEVYRGGEPGQRYIRGAQSSFVLRDGQKYLTSADEAQRIVDAMRKRDSSSDGR
jgi:hypothetical protein